MKGFLRVIAWGAGTILAALLLYACYAAAGALIPVNADYAPAEEGIEVFARSNGFHTDWVLPVRDSLTCHDWIEWLDDSLIRQKHVDARYIVAGWGDEGFYFDSHNGSMPGSGTIARAIFIPTPTVMHIQFWTQPRRSSSMISLRLTPDQYCQLCTFVMSGFAEEYPPKRMAQPGYWAYDYFYRGRGSYHAFNTCNDWANRGAKAAGIRAALAAPFDRCLFYQLRRIQPIQAGPKEERQGMR